MRRVSRRRNSPWPTPRQTLLLRATLGDLDAWAEWSTRPQADPGTAWLLPQLAPRLDALSASGPAAQLVREAFDQTWSRNQALLTRLRPALHALAAAAVPSLAIKGAGVAAVTPRGWGLRPMDDIDVLIRPHDVPAAALALSGADLEDVSPGSAERQLAVGHGASFWSKAGVSLDLHWHPAPGVFADEHVWARASPVSVSGAQLLVPSPEDQLVHACAHGLATGTTGPRWAADVVLIAERGIDWYALIARAQDLGTALTLHDALAFMRSHVGLAVPERVLAELGETRASLTRRAAHHAATRAWRVPLIPTYVELWDLHHRLETRRGGRTSLASYLSFLAARTGEPSRRALLRRWVTRARSGWAR